VVGKKSGQGFYRYVLGKPVKISARHALKRKQTELMTHRMLFAMMNEAVACLRENVVVSEEQLDAGLLFGIGFAPFRGGILRYAHTLGHEKVFGIFSELGSTFGSRFAPDSGWKMFGIGS